MSIKPSFSMQNN